MTGALIALCAIVVGLVLVFAGLLWLVDRVADLFRSPWNRKHDR
jgi:cell division protein FtsX